MTAHLTAAVRMYRFNELGDCFLITFAKGEHTSRMLIDCGSFRNDGKAVTRMTEIVDDIVKHAGGKGLDVVVGTHQHNDHLSGFVHCEDAFKKVRIKEVWLSWLDSPHDRLAQTIGKEHHNFAQALHRARDQLSAVAGGKENRSLGALDDIMGFYGFAAAKGVPQLPAEAVRKLKKLGQGEPQYLRPGTILEMPGMPKDSVRIYVLGPPRKREQLRDVKPGEGESYDHALAARSMSATRFFQAIAGHAQEASSEEEQYPFNSRFKRPAKGERSKSLREVIEHYDVPADKWRRVDDAWLDQGEALALFLDSYTNNSSLVLAIELVASKKVLLFAADAQTGNWQSWFKAKWPDRNVKLDDLLARTVLYKVGHHGSHNATLKDALEKMTRPDLVALIPVHKKDPNIAPKKDSKKKPWKMPAKKLLGKLIEKTSNRVLQMDGVQAPNCDPAKGVAQKSWASIGITPTQTDLFFEVVIDDK